MEENYETNLDMEFKRYLQILRPYLGQLLDEDIIKICNEWIQRLSDCKDNERPLRNKYVFALCYQLARGMLDEPFLNIPPAEELPPIDDSLKSEDSSTEIEYLVINAEESNMKVLFDNKKPSQSDTDILQDLEATKEDIKSSHGKNHNTNRKQTVVCYTCPEILDNCNHENSGEAYEHRAINLIKKLKEIKTQNLLLHKELSELKEESRIKSSYNYAEDYVFMVDNATSAFMLNNDSNSTLKSLKFKLHEAHESRNNLIDKIANLQENLDNLNEMKNHEIEDIVAKHKLEMIRIKTSVREETKVIYEKKTDELKQNYEAKINEIQTNGAKEKEELRITKDDIIAEKDKLISAKDIEIGRLQNQIADLKEHLHSVLDTSLEKPTDEFSNDTIRLKALRLEKQLSKMEKNKTKCARMYEAKLAHLQREKHLAECSLQLQMVRQRAQVVSEVTDDSQAELATALEKLEGKYKEIVANVQTTAIQRRMQDQVALESILHAACSIPGGNALNARINDQFSSKTTRNQSQSYDSEISSLMRGNKVGNVVGGNKSFGEESLLAGYCLNGDRMGELFERVYIPQRDNTETMK